MFGSVRNKLLVTVSLDLPVFLLEMSLSLSLLLLVCNLGLGRRQSQCAWQLPAIFTPSRTLLPPTTSFLDNAALFQFLFHCMMWNNVAHSPLTLSFLDNALQRWTTFSILIWMCTMHNKIFPWQCHTVFFSYSKWMNNNEQYSPVERLHNASQYYISSFSLLDDLHWND